MPVSLHDEDGAPISRAFTSDDIRWACRSAGRVGRHEYKEALFLIGFAEVIGRPLEQIAKECLMTERGYRYLERECGDDQAAIRGLNKIKKFRERVAKIVLKEAYNRKQKDFLK